MRLLEADINVPKIRLDCVQPAVSPITLLVAPLVAFFYRILGFPSDSTTTRSGRALIYK